MNGPSLQKLANNANDDGYLIPLENLKRYINIYLEKVL